jgi:hypothetical protein
MLDPPSSSAQRFPKHVCLLLPPPTSQSFPTEGGRLPPLKPQEEGGVGTFGLPCDRVRVWFVGVGGSTEASMLQK